MIIVEKIFDLVENTEKVIEREATPEEIFEQEKFNQEIAISNAEEAAKKKAREDVLAKLGLTSEEAAALLG